MWSVAAAGLQRPVDAVTHLPPSQRPDSKTVDASFTLLAVIVGYNGDLGAEGRQDSSDTPQTSETYIWSHLPSDFTVICDKCVKHSVEVPTTGADVFMWRYAN